MSIIKGWNTVVINRDTLASIIQFYFDTVLFNSKHEFGDRPRVRTVDWNHVKDGLDIEIITEEK